MLSVYLCDPDTPSLRGRGRSEAQQPASPSPQSHSGGPTTRSHCCHMIPNGSVTSFFFFFFLLYLSLSCPLPLPCPSPSPSPSPPCYDCAPCSCVRPGIQCGLSVRGTFRVSQPKPPKPSSSSSSFSPLKKPRPAPCAPSHCLASCCVCLWGLLQPAATQFMQKKGKINWKLLIALNLENVALQPVRHSSASAARLKDFPGCTTSRSQRRHRRLQGPS